jgi:acetylornithine deacetylase/succinyl-diaminopimelate desuccinylase-like protein
MSKAHDYAKTNAQKFRQQLYELLRIPSVSTDSERAGDVKRAAEWVANSLKQVGVNNVEVCPTEGLPVVYGEWLGAGESAPIVLIYGHYDVQPADVVDGWDHEPFDPIEREGKIYARGASDDKGQMFIHVKAVESLLAAEGKLPVNVKFFIEGEEEIGSKNLGPFLTANKESLKADVCLISDSGMDDISQPAITYSLRGLVAMDLIVTGPKMDLHSGMYGGIVHNPAKAITEIISKLHNSDGSVAVPGFYNDVVPLTPQEREELKKSDIPETKLKEQVGVTQAWGEAGFTLRERVGARPTLEINGIASGFYGEGIKTVLPAKAVAKITCRLVANQQPADIFERIRDYVAKITPATVRSEVRMIRGGNAAALVDINTPAMQAAIAAYEKGWGKRPIFVREGGSIPIVTDFQRELGLLVILMGYGLNSDGAHGPNEHFSVEMFHKGIDTAIHFLYEVATIK